MLYAKRGACRLHWDAERGWVLDVPTVIAQAQLRRVAQWALPRQIERWRSLPPGDRKDELGRAIEQLKQMRITQRLIDHDHDGVMVPFASTQRATTREGIYG